MDGVDEIAIVNDSISHLIPSIPSLPCLDPNRPEIFYRGAQLPNGDILLAGGEMGGCCRYLHYTKGSDQWKIAGTMKKARHQHTSVLIDACLLTTGGIEMFSGGDCTSYLEKFSFTEEVEEKKNLPISLTCHTATVFGKNKMLISGGRTSVGRFMVIFS